MMLRLEHTRSNKAPIQWFSNFTGYWDALKALLRYGLLGPFPEFWGQAQELVFLTSSQTMLMLLVGPGITTENHWAKQFWFTPFPGFYETH